MNHVNFIWNIKKLILIMHVSNIINKKLHKMRLILVQIKKMIKICYFYWI